MKRLIPVTYFLLVLGLFFSPVGQSMAQDRTEEGTKTVIEIKDGKVFLNGEEVAELEDAEGPVLLRRSKDGESEDIWFSNSDIFKGRSGFVMRGFDDDEPFRIRSSPRAFGYVTGDDARVELFSDDDFEGRFEVERLARRYSEEAQAMAERMADQSVRIGSLAPRMNVFYGRQALSEEGREAEMRSRELARKMRMEDGDVAELEAELDAILGQVFDEKQDAHQERIDEMRQKLAELEEQLSQRQQDRADIIEKRKNELLGRSSRYDW